ncbi:MAG TPA: MAPEG family protein [Enterovirga sp.]|nr:MAPEG family protein [Enterovirga sp.]
MNLHDILLPVFVQVGLTFALLFMMGGRRLAALRGGSVRIPDIALGQRAWPAGVQATSNAYANQFELPVLFFALVPLAIITRKADLIFVVLSWVFVVSRLVHAAIFVTTNDVRQRFIAFLVGALALLIMWVMFALRILLVPLPA